MYILIGTVVFWCVFVLGLFVGLRLQKSQSVKEFNNHIVETWTPKRKAEIVHTPTEAEEAYVDKHRKESESSVVLDI